MQTFEQSTLIPGVFRFHAAEIGSTNTEALNRASAGATGPLWITADRQTGGRARSGRSWTSPTGNLAASMLVTLPCGPEVAHHLALLAGVALIDAIRDSGVAPAPGAPMYIKWPNDVLIGGAKVSGILAESTSNTPGTLTAVIGFGVNVAGEPTDVDRAVTSLSRHVPAGAAQPAAEILLMHIAQRMQHWLSVWNCGKDFACIRDAWLERSFSPGTVMSVNFGDGRREGLFAGLDSDGALLLGDERGHRHRITYGDVTIESAHRREG
jgi:BirA family transcriptional regulator, biotin operon repressor / biotin---[acetyl-CoA-carboxylase] ligase